MKLLLTILVFIMLKIWELIKGIFLGSWYGIRGFWKWIVKNKVEISLLFICIFYIVCVVVLSLWIYSIGVNDWLAALLLSAGFIWFVCFITHILWLNRWSIYGFFASNWEKANKITGRK